jgi:hypothetical protein
MMSDRTSNLSNEDVDLTIAALRFMQAKLPEIPPEIRAIATNEGERPLADPQELADQLDDLCEWFNFELPKRPDSE